MKKFFCWLLSLFRRKKQFKEFNPFVVHRNVKIVRFWFDGNRSVDFHGGTGGESFEVTIKKISPFCPHGILKLNFCIVCDNYNQKGKWEKK